jgi:hypothetical protein
METGPVVEMKLNDVKGRRCVPGSTLSAHGSTKIIRSTDPFNLLLSRNGAINHVNVERYCAGPVEEAESVGAFVALRIVFRLEIVLAVAFIFGRAPSGRWNCCASPD